MSRQQSQRPDRLVAVGAVVRRRWRALDPGWQAVAVALCIVVAVVIAGALPW